MRTGTPAGKASWIGPSSIPASSATKIWLADVMTDRRPSG
jgi:hypothetical protein